MSKLQGDLVEGLPTREGVYEVGQNPGDPEEVEVYNHPIKGLCVFAEDIGSSGTGVNDETDCHVSVHNAGLTFIRRMRDLHATPD